MKIDIVSDTLKVWRSTSFNWGETDCLISLADYLITCGYRDFGKPFRNTYNDEKGAYEHIENCGGEKAIINKTDLLMTMKPERGDIVLVKIKDMKITGICTGDYIAFRTQQGVAEMRINFIVLLQAWRVTQCPL